MLQIPNDLPTFEQGLKTALQKIRQTAKSLALEDLDDLTSPGA